MTICFGRFDLEISDLKKKTYTIIDNKTVFKVLLHKQVYEILQVVYDQVSMPFYQSQETACVQNIN